MSKQICKRCILDSDIPGIEFNKDGICNYCLLHNDLDKQYPLDSFGKENFKNLINKIKKKGRKKKYDCIVGISGGTDSTYTLLKAVKLGLRPLAVHFDNGWNSELAVSNIYNVLKKLKVDLRTYVVDWEEFKDIQLSFLKASVIDIEQPSDLGIVSTLYKVANEKNIKYILNGVSFRTEGNIPFGWGYSDGKYIKSVQKIFGKKKIRSYPNLSLSKVIYYTLIKKIKLIRFLNYFDYSKQRASEILKKEVGWRKPSGHHFESIYTRFFQAYVSPIKFGVDRRLISISAQIRSGHISREEGFKIINSPHYSKEESEADKAYIAKKFIISNYEFESILNRENKEFLNYPTYYPMLKRMKKLIKLLSKLKILPIIYHEKKYQK